MSVQFQCSDEERRAAVQGSALNGVDFLEVVDRDAPDPRLRQRLLVVRMLQSIAPGLSVDHVRLRGGTRVPSIGIDWAMPLPDVAGAAPALVPQWHKDAVAAYFAGEAHPDRVLLVLTDTTGDYSTYTLALVDPLDETLPPTGFDPRLSEVDFSFKVECDSDFDCKAQTICPPAELSDPRLGYLAKDYTSFRRVMLDRLSAIAPGWLERNPADIGIALVELMAYVGDRLSYFQDAVATEAYLGTARRRVSIRRHARLVDYRMHDGVNARAWVHLEVGPGADGATIPAGTVLSTPGNERHTTLPPDPREIRAVMRQGGVCFETMHDVTPRQALNEVPFYTWTDRECCLPTGATLATLQHDPIPGLGPGSFLLFEEAIGPRTGAEADADLARRHVVRLTAVENATDPLDGTAIIEIEWDDADALPFPVCLSARTDDAHGREYVDRVSVARGNLVLADHGINVKTVFSGDDDIDSTNGQSLGKVPHEPRFYRPALTHAPVTHAATLPERFPEDDDAIPAVGVLDYRAEDGIPQIDLSSSDGRDWTAQRDLLSSDRFRPEFVLEVDQDGATIRMGDDVNGVQPDAGVSFHADYRVGNGSAGNVGADTISQIYTSQGGIEAVRNPLPASGGVDAESMVEVRRYAPQAFREQQRAVTESDYARAAERHGEVDRAEATFRWTGSWHTVFVTVDRRHGRKVDDEFKQGIREHLSLYRMAGYDLEIDAPRFVPLAIELQVCVKPDYQRSAVKQALLDALSCRTLADGTQGFFHPDRWTFGQPVYLSRIVAAAMAVEGVASVQPTVFKRWDREAGDELDERVLTTERLEIARLDNDPSFQENGLLTLHVGGGR